jgi:hypothetical protein
MEPREKKTYVVIFQIAERVNREALRQAFRSLNSYCPLSNTAWAITSDKSAEELRDEFAKFTVKPDRLYVLEAGGTGAWRNAISKEHTDWLKANL